MNSNKYKSVLCKHFGQTGTCSYGDKCQFAHGFQELKNSGGGQGGQLGNGSRNDGGMGGNPMSQHGQGDQNKNNKQPPNPSNFKIVKCKNFEANGSCKYGSVCTFAHGDPELRTKSDNNLQMSENAITMDTGFMPMQGNPYLMQDPSYIYNLMLQQQMYDMSGMQGGQTQGGQTGIQGTGQGLGQGQGMNLGGPQGLGQMCGMGQFQGQGGQGGFQGQNTNGDLNLNDMNNNPFLIGMNNMMNYTDPNSLNQMQQNNNNNNNDQPSTDNNVPSNL